MKKNIFLGMLGVFLAFSLGTVAAEIIIEDLVPLVSSRDRESGLLKPQ